MIVIETIRVKSTHPETQGPFVIINKADFDPERHESLEAEAEESAEQDMQDTQDDAPTRRGRKPKTE